MEKIVVGSPLAIFEPHVAEIRQNCHHTQHFSASHLTSYEVLLLIVHDITLLHYSNLNPATLVPSINNNVLTTA